MLESGLCSKADAEDGEILRSVAGCLKVHNYARWQMPQGQGYARRQWPQRQGYARWQRVTLNGKCLIGEICWVVRRADLNVLGGKTY